jgi:hypothetical protein
LFVPLKKAIISKEDAVIGIYGIKKLTRILRTGLTALSGPRLFLSETREYVMNIQVR